MSFKSVILDLIFPKKCIFCRCILEKEEYICEKCEKNILPLEGMNAKEDGDFFKYCVCAYEYKDEVREAILRYKFSDLRYYGEYFGKVLSRTVEENVDTPCDIITYVPVSKKRLRKRGYDQSEILSSEVSKILEIPLVRTLDKVKDNPAQSTVEGDDKRRANVMDVYKIRSADDVKGKNILLVDDIITSGATLSECARELLMAGAKQVVCAALAKKP